MEGRQIFHSNNGPAIKQYSTSSVAVTSKENHIMYIRECLHTHRCETYTFYFAYRFTRTKFSDHILYPTVHSKRSILQFHYDPARTSLLIDWQHFHGNKNTKYLNLMSVNLYNTNLQHTPTNEQVNPKSDAIINEGDLMERLAKLCMINDNKHWNTLPNIFPVQKQIHITLPI